MFIALKYGAAAMAAAALYRRYVKQNGELDPKMIVLDDATKRRRNLMAWDRELGRPRGVFHSPAHLIAAADAPDRLRDLHNMNYDI